MPQLRIPLAPGRIYHIWTHANGDENLFREDENYNYFLHKYEYYIHPVADTFAYCLMPNHLHLMVRIKSEVKVLEFIRTKKSNPSTLQGFETLGGFSNVISRQFSHLFNAYTQAYNKRYNRKGGLFIPNFKRKLIHNSRYFKTCIAYIHSNPVHHKFVPDQNDWLHSSWHAYLLNKATKIRKDEGIGWFGSKEQFIRVHREIAVEKLIPLFEG